MISEPHRLLSQAPLALLDLLPATSKQGFLQLMSVRTFNRRELIVKPDQPSPGLMFLLEGRVQGVDFTVDGREAGLYFINPGQYFGELAVLDGENSPEYVIAVMRSTVATLPPTESRRLLFSSPVLAERVTLGLAARIRQLTWQRSILALGTPLQRVSALLIHLLEESAEQGSILAVPTHQELAIMVNTSRESVSRIFQSLQNEGTILRNGTDLIILKPEQLRQHANGQ